MNVLRMTDLDLAGKRVLIREDLNVPIETGSITSDARIRASLPTIRHAIEKRARVILLSHLGRPKEGEFSAENSPSLGRPRCESRMTRARFSMA